MYFNGLRARAFFFGYYEKIAVEGVDEIKSDARHREKVSMDSIEHDVYSPFGLRSMTTMEPIQQNPKQRAVNLSSTRRNFLLGQSSSADVSMDDVKSCDFANSRSESKNIKYDVLRTASKYDTLTN
jgi:hypothetical protein